MGKIYDTARECAINLATYLKEYPPTALNPERKVPPVRPATAAELGVAAGGPISMPGWRVDETYTSVGGKSAVFVYKMPVPPPSKAFDLITLD